MLGSLRTVADNVAKQKNLNLNLTVTSNISINSVLNKVKSANIAIGYGSGPGGAVI